MSQDKGHTALAEAVRIQNLDMVALLLSCQANPNIVDEDTGMTPLLYSISNSSYRITNELLKYNADPNITNFNGVTGLMIAASLGDINTCRLLVKFNANIDFVDHNGWTALHYSALKDNLDVCDFLLCEGVDKDMKDNKRRKAIHIAKHLGNGMVVALLESFKRRIITKSLPYEDYITQRRLNEIKAADLPSAT
jgi:ankyrin repeat protein